MPCATQEQFDNKLSWLTDPHQGNLRNYWRKLALVNACAIRTTQVINRLEPDVEHCLITGKPGCCDECMQPICLFTV